jgi:hypothetical protein
LWKRDARALQTTLSTSSRPNSTSTTTANSNRRSPRSEWTTARCSATQHQKPRQIAAFLRRRQQQQSRHRQITA